MNQRVIISGFFLRQNAWPSAVDARCFDDWRDVQGMDLNGWLDRAQAALATCVEPLTLCGHSFGGYLAQCLAARLGERVSHLCLFSGLVSEGGSALESYQESRQSALMSLCRLEAAEGQIRLQEPERFCELLQASVALATSEPAQMLLDAPPPDVLKLRCRVSYVIPLNDALTPVATQQHFAQQLNAHEIYCPGGHLSPLRHTWDVA